VQAPAALFPVIIQVPEVHPDPEADIRTMIIPVPGVQTNQPVLLNLRGITIVLPAVHHRVPAAVVEAAAVAAVHLPVHFQRAVAVTNYFSI
jgi:hypothetical protein